MTKQIMNVRDVMAVLEVSESKAYGMPYTPFDRPIKRMV